MPVRALAAAGKGALWGGRALAAARATGLATKATQVAKGLGVAEKGLSGLTSLSGKIKGVGQGLISATNKIPGSSWLGLNVAEKAPMAFKANPLGWTKFHAKNITKPLVSMAGLGIGSEALQGASLRGQFNDLSVDPNFREWMGPDRQDALLEKTRTDDDRVNSMRTLRDGGYMDSYKRHLANATKEQKQRMEDQARAAALDAARKQNVG